MQAQHTLEFPSKFAGFLIVMALESVLPIHRRQLSQESVDRLLPSGFWFGYLVLLHGLASFAACPFPLCLAIESSELLRARTTKKKLRDKPDSGQIHWENVDWRETNLQRIIKEILHGRKWANLGSNSRGNPQTFASKGALQIRILFAPP
jgi:hypothetical protein